MRDAFGEKKMRRKKDKGKRKNDKKRKYAVREIGKTGEE
jgi:hypothetical protein